MHMEMSTYLLSLMLFPDGSNYSPPNRPHLLKLHQLYLIILVDSVYPKSSILIKDQPFIMNSSPNFSDSVEMNNSSEVNGIVERTNQKELIHLKAFLFDNRVHDKWSFKHFH